METFSSARSLVRALAPQVPVTCLRPAAATRACQYFLDNFPGNTLYAVKTNPDPEILDAVYNAGIRRFDVASPSEIELVSARYADAEVCFMHPIKNRRVIAQAYHQYGVRTFALDSHEELQKIRDATGNAEDLTLLVRLAVPNHHAAFTLSHKFGISREDAPALLSATRQVAARLGVCFHVGSQCLQPSAYGTALRLVRDLIHRTDILLDVVDIGGGFPSIYPGMTSPPLAAYMSEIRSALDILPTMENCETWCEPGRALVAEAASTLVRVDMRKDDCLYINDGTYGSLFDAGSPGFRYPVACIRAEESTVFGLQPFSFYGPTCDSLDYMKGPFMLPADMHEGDYIEIGLTGAYGAALQTRFNGFYSDAKVLLDDEPMMTLYGPESEQQIFAEMENVTPIEVGA
jgi:ornithine decarboxylase